MGKKICSQVRIAKIVILNLDVSIDIANFLSALSIMLLLFHIGTIG